ncbi:hypothetical protein EJ06DRAFT_527100 [Trichodelitschia bisporula]|uniref:RING-type domain-containing protein n=1 Tax=Trichodelitschia bisporula TaxID=703511 RepID=A0A6G1I5S6_9PEZI|nr:hypothetical protein EJ06DRAFT_527100 [Trichodelitschia bisporula]
MASILFSLSSSTTPERPSSRDCELPRDMVTVDEDSDLDSPDVEPEEPNLRDLNASLRALADIFPDIQPDVFREMLERVSAQSRLEIVTEHLLKNDAKWIRGRYRRTQDAKHKKATSDPPTSGSATVHLGDTFRNEAYKSAVRSVLREEFKGLSRSAIEAVLAENNYSYTPSRTELLALAAKSWRLSFSNFFLRRKTPNPAEHPLVYWSMDARHPRAVPKLRKTRNRELNKELYDTLISPQLNRRKEAQELIDYVLAKQLQAKEAEQAEEMYDCECCYATSTVHEMSVCDDGGHNICFRCISHATNEAIYGQGWARSVNPERGTLRCIAPVMDSDGECHGCIPIDMVRLALAEKENGKQILNMLQERLASDALLKSKVKLVQCPFCPYAEADEVQVPHITKWRFKRIPELTLCISWFLFVLAFVGVLPYFLLVVSLYLVLSPYIHISSSALQQSLGRVIRKRYGLCFTCRSPSCSKLSCMRCQSVWKDPHACFTSQLNSLQGALEGAMTAAVKRTCPKCNVSFVKSTGCNKLICVCGYTMCYLCRNEIGTEGYGHFCQHFRAAGGQCTECEKCDLYRAEDEDVVVKRAKERAEKEWWENEGRGIEKSFVVKSQPLLREGIFKRCTWEAMLDSVMETFVA